MEENKDKIEEDINKTSAVEEQPTTESVETSQVIENQVEPEKKKKNNVGLIVIIILILCCGGFATWYFALGGNKVLSGNKEEKRKEKKEEKSKEESEEIIEEEKQEETKEEQEIIGEKTVEIKVDDTITELYNKYSIGNASDEKDWGSSVEYSLYHKKVVDITKYNRNDTTVFYTFDGKILDMAKNELDKYKKDYSDKTEFYGDYVPATDEVRSIIKKYFDKYFGHVIEYDDKYFNSCNPLNLRDEVNYFFYSPQWCGAGNVTNKLEYTITKAEKSEKNIYLYVDYKIYEIWVDDPDYKIFNTKWTFVKQPDDNYYFLKAEPVE